MPGTGTRVRGGLTDSEGYYIMKKCKRSNSLVGCDITELNPLLDRPKEPFFGDFPELEN